MISFETARGRVAQASHCSAMLEQDPNAKSPGAPLILFQIVERCCNTEVPHECLVGIHPDGIQEGMESLGATGPSALPGAGAQPCPLLAGK